MGHRHDYRMYGTPIVSLMLFRQEFAILLRLLVHWLRMLVAQCQACSPDAHLSLVMVCIVRSILF